ncbi:MAG: PIN domain-containing protein [Spirochaetaceae bacterium]|nr:PIN domain-containing protein [Spirochaetaceae bacterium]
MTLIDTSAWIEQLRRVGDASVRGQVETHLASGDAAWCPLVRLELWNGARGEHERTALTDMGETLPSLPIDAAVWDRAATLASGARRRGITIPATDLLVAACARHHEVALLHHDRHFELIASL